MEPLPSEPKALIDALYDRVHDKYCYQWFYPAIRYEIEAFANEMLAPHGLVAQQVISANGAVQIMLKVKDV